MTGDPGIKQGALAAGSCGAKQAESKQPKLWGGRETTQRDLCHPGHLAFG